MFPVTCKKNIFLNLKRDHEKILRSNSWYKLLKKQSVTGEYVKG
jgi:hypothetical protein